MKTSPNSQPTNKEAARPRENAPLGWHSEPSRTKGWNRTMAHIAEILGHTRKNACTIDPVWHDSTTSAIKWVKVSKKKASQIWHQARIWDRQTRAKNKHGGCIGRTGLAVLYSLLWDTLNWKTGQLDPSIETIARRANVGRTATINALKRLKKLRIIDWIRRSLGSIDENGEFRLRQLTNAYAVAGPDSWARPKPPDPPQPHPSELGFPTPVPDAIDAAIASLKGDSCRSAYSELMGDQTDRLAVALAQLGRAMGRI